MNRLIRVATAVASVAAVLCASAPQTVDEFIADAQCRPSSGERAGHWSTFRSDINGEKGPCRPNLTTTVANDWLSRAMGEGPSSLFASAAGTATATSATSLTNSGATFPTTGQGLQGRIVVALTTGVWGVIASNTSTVLTIDQWYNTTSTSGAAGTTPSGTTGYVILTAQFPACWLAVSNAAHTPVVGDTTLSSELTGSGFVRAVGTYAHTVGATTYTLTFTWTATATQTIVNEAQFAAANTTAGGYMPFESAEPSSPTLVSGDTLQNTITITV